MIEVVLAIAFLAAPLLALPAVFRRDPAGSRTAVFAFFVVPFVGVATYCFLAPLGWSVVVTGYPIALVSLGFWAALLASAGTLILKGTAMIEQNSTFRVVAGAASGAAVGGIFMLGYSLVGLVVRPEVDTAAVVRCAVAGSVAGSIGGAFAGYSLRSRSAALSA
jgi:hypothetical protein